MESVSTELGLEFVIDKSQSIFVKTAEERIAHLFKVQVELKGVFEGSTKHKQWISVIGTEHGASKAKEYILALTSPAETICMKNIWGHPLFTQELVDEIERCSCAALSKCEDNSLVIRGTELSVMVAQSLIDDMFSKTSADITDKETHRKDYRNTIPDSGAKTYCTDQDSSVKENDRDELRGTASLNKNNSSLTSVVPQSSSTSTVAAANYSNGFLTSDPRSSPHKNTSSLYTAFSPSGADVFLACTSTPYNNKAFSGEDGHYHPGRDGKDLPFNEQRNERTVTEQRSTGRRLFPHEIISNSLYASASAICPRTTGAEMFVSSAPQFYTHGTTSQTQVAFHTVNHTGDGAVSKDFSYFPTNLQHSGQVGYSEAPMEVCSLDPGMGSGSTHLTPQAKDQQIYLRNLGQSLHYTNEDIEKGLSCYSMDDIVKPREFLKTLNRIKAQRHGGGHQNIGTDYREIPNMSHASAALAVSNTVSKTAPQAASSEMSVDDYSDLDASVICLGADRSDDVSTIIVSSEDEIDEPEEAMSDFPVPPNHAPPTNFPSQPPSKFQPAVRREPTACMDREMTMNRDSVTMAENSAIHQKPTVHRRFRYIIIDGSNVAMSHGNHKVFSVEGLRICISYFVNRGHDRITAFIPEWRRYSENQTPITGRALLEKLHDDGYIKFTPARRINGKTIASYDDRFILNLAEKEDGVVVSNDQFRDLCQERASYQKIVANSLLQYMFVGDHFMPPDDPLGRHGPHLDDFLAYPQQMSACNSGRETPPLNAEEWVMVNPRQPIQRQPIRKNFDHKKSQPARSQTVTAELFLKLTQMFPEPNQAPQIHTILNNHKDETDLNRLTNYCMNALFL